MNTPDDVSDTGINALVENGEMPNREMMINPHTINDLIPTYADRQRKRHAQEAKYHAQLLRNLPKLNDAEEKMRRAFRRWEKYSKLCERLEKQLDKIDRERFIDYDANAREAAECRAEERLDDHLMGDHPSRTG
jgi:hypothetical protein